jgi:hypothetical protein
MEGTIALLVSAGKGGTEILPRLIGRLNIACCRNMEKMRKVPHAELTRLKGEAQRRHLGDVREDNIRFVEGRFKIVDASKRH